MKAKKKEQKNVNYVCLNNDYLAVSPKRHETHALRQLKIYVCLLNHWN